jgi:hypothetical protein
MINFDSSIITSYYLTNHNEDVTMYYIDLYISNLIYTNINISPEIGSWKFVILIKNTIMTTLVLLYSY